MSLESLLERYYAHLKKIQVASTLRNVAANDQNTRMPPAAQQTRSDQLVYLSEHIQELSRDAIFAEIIESLYEQRDQLSEKDQRSLMLSRSGLTFGSLFPEGFMERYGQAKSTALAHRHIAKKENDRSVLAPHLGVSFAMAGEYASLYDAGRHPLSVHCDGAQPGMSYEHYEELFAPVKTTCLEILQFVGENTKDANLTIYDFDRQQLYRLLQELMSSLGFDLEQGVLTFTKWPYSENCGPWDERIQLSQTTPLLETILAAMHEAGHGLTDMHIDPVYHRTNIHRSVPMGMHEAIARGLENIIGRSRPFCVYLASLLNKYFAELGPWDDATLYTYLNTVSPSLKRVEADEVSYNLHIIIRFEIEKEIFAGALTMEDLPARRNELYKHYLGVVPQNDLQGCLQDQHWSLGLFGYFPAYALGNIIGAQLRVSFTDQHPERNEQIAMGDFSAYFKRHKEQIWQHGNLKNVPERVELVTGNPISSDAFIKYLTEKYT